MDIKKVQARYYGIQLNNSSLEVFEYDIYLSVDIYVEENLVYIIEMMEEDEYENIVHLGA